MKLLTLCWIGALLLATAVLANGQRELRLSREALQEVHQELVGQTIVMVASGWDAWPTLPQCTYEKDGVFTNPPCLYGGMRFPQPRETEVPPESEPLPPWRIKVSR
jgi:hypothetical protein